MSTANVIFSILFIGACIVCDIRSRRIPNVLTLSGLLIGVALNVAVGGYAGLLQSALGFLVAFALLVPVFSVGGIGGGDVKMMAAVGAMLGARVAVLGLVCGVVAGGVLMLAHLWRIGRAREKLQATLHMVVAAFHGGSLAPLKAPSIDPSPVTLPYSVPLGVGVLFILSLRAWAGV